MARGNSPPACSLQLSVGNPPFAFREGYGWPNAVNLQVVDPLIFIPNPLYDKGKESVFVPMQKDNSKRLRDAGEHLNSIQFVNTTQMSGFGGEAPCATNVGKKRNEEILFI